MFIQYVRFTEVKKVIEEKEFSKIENFYENIENIYKSFLVYCEADLNTLTESIENSMIKDIDEEHIYDKLQTFLNDRQYYNEVAYIDKDGKEIMAIEKKPDGLGIISTCKNGVVYENLRSLLKNEEIYMANIEKSEKYHGDLLIKALYKEDQLIGYVKVKLKMKILLDRIKAYSKRNGYENAPIMINPEKTYVFHPNNNKIWTKVQDEKILNMIKSNSKDMLVYKENKQVVVFKKSKLTDDGKQSIYMLLCMDEDKYIHEDLNTKILFEIIYAGAILITLGILITIYLAKPILKLADTVEEVGRGNFNVAIDIKSGDEIEVLGNKIQEMANHLKYMYHNMEKLVDERTKELKMAHKELKELANTDSLTGLYNRHYFNRFIETQEKAIRHNKNSFGIFIIDIDKFKYINDFYGHNVGDEILVQVANILKNSTTNEDVVVRYGGDEFLIGLVDSNEERVKNIINNINHGVNILNRDSSFLSRDISLSIGYEEYDFKSTINECIKGADEKMYKDKRRKG
jgi:diguanylate cyclase (GGDEF)-like protein